MRKKMIVMNMADKLLLEDDAFAALIFFSALSLSILARFLMASSVISLINFWSEASSDRTLGGLGGLGGFLKFFFICFSSTSFLSTKAFCCPSFPSEFLSINNSTSSAPTSPKLDEFTNPWKPTSPVHASIKSALVCPFAEMGSLIRSSSLVVPPLSRSTSSSLSLETNRPIIQGRYR